MRQKEDAFRYVDVNVIILGHFTVAFEGHWPLYSEDFFSYTYFSL